MTAPPSGPTPTASPATRSRTRPSRAIVLLSVLGGVALIAAVVIGGVMVVQWASSSVPSPGTDGTPAPGGAADEGELPTAPAEDLTMAAGARLPTGLEVSLSSGFSAETDWQAEMGSAGEQVYRQAGTDCTVRFATLPYASASGDDLRATIDGMSEKVGADFSTLQPAFLTFPYDPAGGLIGAGADAEHTVELAAFPASGPDAAVITAGRAISATDRLILVEMRCPDIDDLVDVGLLTTEALRVSVFPAAFMGG